MGWSLRKILEHDLSIKIGRERKRPRRWKHAHCFTAGRYNPHRPRLKHFERGHRNGWLQYLAKLHRLALRKEKASEA